MSSARDMSRASLEARRHVADMKLSVHLELANMAKGGEYAESSIRFATRRHMARDSLERKWHLDEQSSTSMSALSPPRSTWAGVAVSVCVVMLAGMHATRAQSSQTADRDRAEVSSPQKTARDRSRRRPSIESILAIDDPDPTFEDSLEFDQFRIEETLDSELHGIVLMINWLERYVQTAPIAFTSYGPGLELQTGTLDETNRSVRFLGTVVIGWGFTSIRVGF